LSLFSFALWTPIMGGRVRFPWARFLAYAFFAVLSGFQTRMIPFFAVVAGPVTVLNFQDYLRGRVGQRAGRLYFFGTSVPFTRLVALGRLATVASLALLIFYAWPGWLRPTDQPRAPRQGAAVAERTWPRRVAWRLQPDPSLVATAQALDRLHQKDVDLHGKANPSLRGGFNYSPDLAPYCAWYCQPGRVRLFYDSRWPLFAKTVTTYGRIRQGLREGRAKPGDPQPEGDNWRQAVRKHDLTYLVLPFRPKHPELLKLVALRWLDGEHWPLLYEDGKNIVFAWNEDEGERFAGLAKDFRQEAFGDLCENDRLPGQGPDPPQGSRGFWAKYLEGEPVRPLAYEDLEFYAIFSLSSVEWHGVHRELSWTLCGCSGISAAVAPASVTMPAIFGANMRLPFLNEFRAAAFPVLMVRRARQGLIEAPTYSQGYRKLFQAVSRISNQEDSWSTRMDPKANRKEETLRSNVRLIQRLTALESQLLLDPNDPDIHYQLAFLYGRELGYLDVAHQHLAQAIQHVERAPIGSNKAQWLKALPQTKQRYQKEFAQLDEILKRQLRDFQVRGARLPTLRQVRLALDPYQYEDENGNTRQEKMGLALLALEILQRTPEAQFRNEEKATAARWQIQLLLSLGRAAEARHHLRDLRQFKLRFHQLEVQAAAALGDYDDAELALKELEEAVYVRLPAQKKIMVELLTNEAVAGVVPGPAGLFTPAAIHLATLDLTFRDLEQGGLTTALQFAGGVTLLRGILALERGDATVAARHFQHTIDLVGTRVHFPDRGVAQRYLSFIEEMKR